MRRADGELGGANITTLDTINAAASAIASAETRVRQSSVQKKRWGSCWSIYSCFGSDKQNRRIVHANLSPDQTTSSSRTEPSSSENQTQSQIPFLSVAPPSSPASSLYSELPSAAQSPAGSLSFTPISANMYSPSGPASMFAIGPYAHETQLVSPPVFSTFTTEPSTAPFTPPPESVHMTTPSSPEVPFARLLDRAVDQNGQRFPYSNYEFQSYQLYPPGSPVGNLMSSGTSSPFEHPQFVMFRTGQDSGSLTPMSRDSVVLDRQNSDVGPLTNSFSGWRNDQADHRVSFEITAEEVVRCVEKKSRAAMNSCDETMNDTTRYDRNRRSGTLGSAKEFNFDSVDEHEPPPPCKHWSFFPMMQSGVS